MHIHDLFAVALTGAARASDDRAASRVWLNGESHPLGEPCMLLVWLERRLEKDLHNLAGVAVSVDGQVVPRASWGTFSLRGGEKIELVRAVQGG